MAAALECSLLFWVALHVVGVAICLRLWIYVDRKPPYGWFTLSWLSMTMAGVSSLADESPVRHLMVIAMRIAASVTGLVALVSLARIARSRTVTLWTTKQGDVLARGAKDVMGNVETLRPPKLMVDVDHDETQDGRRDVK